MNGAAIPRRNFPVHGVPAGWKLHGKPGSGRGGVRTGGGVGGKPTAEANGSEQGKLQGKLEGSFMSIHNPSRSNPLTGSKKVLNSVLC